MILSAWRACTIGAKPCMASSRAASNSPFAHATSAGAVVPLAATRFICGRVQSRASLQPGGASNTIYGFVCFVEGGC